MIAFQQLRNGVRVLPCPDLVLCPASPLLLQLRAARQLPGSNPQLLGVLPTVWLHLPGTDCHPEPVLGLLLSVLLPPQRLPTQLRGPQALLQRRAAGLEPALRLLVCSSQTGELRHWRDWLRQDERPMYVHPRFGVPTWDSE